MLCLLTNRNFIVLLAHELISEVDMAVEQFAKLQKIDPNRLDNMDLYSNLLYVKVAGTSLTTCSETQNGELFFFCVCVL